MIKIFGYLQHAWFPVFFLMVSILFSSSIYLSMTLFFYVFEMFLWSFFKIFLFYF